jgi:hypothetical protein
MNQKNHASDRHLAERTAGAESVPLLLTKLYRPPVTPDLEQRSRLMERLDRNRHRPLTLISAPAGYGKTMLASMWLEACHCPSRRSDRCGHASFRCAGERLCTVCRRWNDPRYAVWPVPEFLARKPSERGDSLWSVCLGYQVSRLVVRFAGSGPTFFQR